MMEEIPDVWTIFGKIIIYTWNLKDLMSGQPTPSLTYHPPRNKTLLQAY